MKREAICTLSMATEQNLKTQDCLDRLQEGMITMSRKFWNWVRNDNEDRILVLNGEIFNEEVL